MLDVFVSYSRKNLDFVQHLSADLEQSGKQIWFDKKKEPLQGIPAGSLWWDEIKHGIETADNFLMIISPQSMMSPYCHAEVSHALKHNKRIVTLLYCSEQSQTETLEAINSAIDSIDSDLLLPENVSANIENLRSLARRNWLELSQIQFVSYVDVRDWEQWFKQVIDAVDLDIQWVRLWGQFRQAVQIWAENDYSDDFRWSEPRLKPVREMVEKREQTLNDDENDFIQPEQEHLYRELEDINTTHQRRYVIGERLNDIGDIREGVGVKDGKPEMLWLPVTGSTGKYPFKDQKDQVFGKFKVGNFFIAKYLSTNTQVQAFLDSDWDNPLWWQGFPEKYQSQKFDFDSVTNGMNNAPRDTISWYQSVAFGRWLNHQLQGSVLTHPSGQILQIGDNAQLRLPTEWEWQWVTMNGRDEREYPWGELDEYPRSNTTEASIQERSTAVGMYPDGVADCAALDMSGNLWEWCANNYLNPEIIDPTDIHSKVLRGGAFSFEMRFASCAYRYDVSPHYAFNNFGVRLVVSSIIPEFW